MQRDLAALLGITPAAVSHKIAGRSTWSATDLVKAAAFLDLPLAELLSDEMVAVEQKKLAPNSSESEANLSRLWESNPRPSHYE
ncbi:MULTISPECIES: helix-turn-helix domain-containing protein [Trueperella]